jgi:hypothetical protein
VVVVRRDNSDFQPRFIEQLRAPQQGLCASPELAWKTTGKNVGFHW